MDKEKLQDLQQKVNNPRLNEEERLQAEMKKMHRSLNKHFGHDLVQELKAQVAWDFFSTDLFNKKKIISKISAVNVKLPVKATGVRALYEGIDEAPVDEQTKLGFRHKLQGMVDNLKGHNAYEVIFEAAMANLKGFDPFPIDPTKVILMLEKMANKPDQDTSDEE